MQKFVISILGQDRPGIIARATRAMFQQQCNIENISQTIVQTEFSGIFIVSAPPDLQTETLQAALVEETASLSLYVYVKLLIEPKDSPSFKEREPFVITTEGPDRMGLITEMTSLMASYQVNVTNLKAVFKGGDNPRENHTIYEVDIPVGTNKKALDRDLREKAGELGLEISIQHRNIFEAIHRI